jgi:hypothetical protein
MAALIDKDFWKWPEWQALIKRLGVTQNENVRDFLLWVPFEGAVEITMSYFPEAGEFKATELPTDLLLCAGCNRLIVPRSKGKSLCYACEKRNR